MILRGVEQKQNPLCLRAIVHGRPLTYAGVKVSAVALYTSASVQGCSLWDMCERGDSIAPYPQTVQDALRIGAHDRVFHRRIWSRLPTMQLVHAYGQTVTSPSNAERIPVGKNVTAAMRMGAPVNGVRPFLCGNDTYTYTRK